MTRYLLLLQTPAGVPTAWLSAPSINTLCAWLPARWTSPLVPGLVAALQEVEPVPRQTQRVYLGRWGGEGRVQAWLLCERRPEEDTACVPE